MATRRGSKPRNIVFVVAHPDDLSNSMGGTALLLKGKYALHDLCLTRGERGLSRTPRRETGVIRAAEERASCRIVGARLRFLGQVNGEACAGREICAKVARMLKALKPVALFTLWPLNTHDEHIAAYTIAITALRTAGLLCETEIYLSENDPGGQTNQFVPDVYVNIDSVIEKKREMVRCHKCQFPDETKVQTVIDRNVFRGRLARCSYAEGFKTFFPLVNARWGRKAKCLLFDL